MSHLWPPLFPSVSTRDHRSCGTWKSATARPIAPLHARLYSVIAGFVEPGETLEEAVVREVREEVGIVVKNIHYFGSQPWPFPHSLMIGFTATYAGGDIFLSDSEIEDAGWFTSQNLPACQARSALPASSLTGSFRSMDWGKRISSGFRVRRSETHKDYAERIAYSKDTQKSWEFGVRSKEPNNLITQLPNNPVTQDSMTQRPNDDWTL